MKFSSVISISVLSIVFVSGSIDIDEMMKKGTTIYGVATDKDGNVLGNGQPANISLISHEKNLIASISSPTVEYNLELLNADKIDLSSLSENVGKFFLKALEE